MLLDIWMSDYLPGVVKEATYLSDTTDNAFPFVFLTILFLSVAQTSCLRYWVQKALYIWNAWLSMRHKACKKCYLEVHRILMTVLLLISITRSRKYVEVNNLKYPPTSKKNRDLSSHRQKNQFIYVRVVLNFQMTFDILQKFWLMTLTEFFCCKKSQKQSKL